MSDLVQLWMAEGFIPHIAKHKQEQTARKCASELVQVVSKSKAHGWIEEIRIHDILRDWCIEEARYAGFVDAIDNTSGQASCPLCVYRSLILNVFFGWLLRCYVL